MLDIETLNNAQREAVECIDGPLLVLAGAGSGKTKVLTYRIAYMLEQGVSPWQILAITFTNKAAAEMRERLGALVGSDARSMWVSTFHSMCVRILRENAARVGYSKNFTIYDDDDSKRLLKDIMAELNIDPKRWPINAIRNRISSAKNELILPHDFSESAKDPLAKVAASVYTRLQERLHTANAFDFDDLLVYTFLLFKQNDDVLAAYQDRFKYILVDEYQDTNHAQYKITQLLAAQYKNIMVVGDDDQSIYSWRGADIRNILEFESDYPQARVIKLEQNYRSTGNILNAANAVVANNQHRKSKKLFTEAGDGERIFVYQAADERDEGRWIAGEIEHQHGSGVPYEEIAILYRTNAQSRSLEDMLLRAGVPYRLVGGTRFFDRKEIRDVMAYLTLVINPTDDIAAKRIINVPRRGIGKTTIEHIDAIAATERVSFMEATRIAIHDTTLQTRTRSLLASFVGLIDEAATYTGDLRNIVEAIIEKSGIIVSLEAENSDEAQGRIENIKELLSVVEEYVDTHQVDESAQPAEGVLLLAAVRQLSPNSLPDFIEWVRLRTDLDTVSDDESAITLMTVHAAKGLEFDIVFIAGMEESLFPHTNSIRDAAGVEEERRLAYVAITRARKRLYITCALARQIFGSTSSNPASRFLREIPQELRKNVGVGSAGFSGTGWEKRGSRRGISGSGTEAGGGRVFGASSAQAYRKNAVSAQAFAKREKIQWSVGDIVDHKTFGRGKILKVDGDTLEVLFEKTRSKKNLLADYAPIVKIG